MDVTIISLGWFLLPLITSILSIYSFHLFKKDRDNRKAIFSIAFAGSTISYVYLFTYYIGINTGPLGFRFFDWLSIPIILAVFIAANDYFIKPKNYNHLLKIFIFIFILCFIIPIFPLETVTISNYFRMIIAIEILFVSVFAFIQTKNLSYLLFFLAMTSLSIGGMTLFGNQNLLGLYAQLIGFSFLALIFFNWTSEKHGVSSFFTLNQQLEEAKQRINETKQSFQTLFEQMIDPVVIVDRKGTVLEASNKFFDTLGITKEEMIGQNFLSTSFFDKKTKRKLIKNVILRIAGIHIKPYEITVYAKNGTPIPFEIHAGKITYQGKSADMAVFRDLRERKKTEKQLRENEKKYRTVFENTGTAMGLFADDGIISMTNERFTDLTGYSRKEVEHKLHWFDFVTEKDKQRLFSYHKKQSEQRGNLPSEYTCSINTKMGDVKMVHVSISVIPDSSIRVVSLLDITPLKETQRKLDNLNRNLEKKVDLRTTEIQRLLKQKDEFVNQLGHDLKNPIGPLLNLIPLLEKHETDPQRKEIFQVVMRNISHIKNLVTKTIQLAQLNAPSTTLNFDNIDLSSLIRESLQRNKTFFAENNIQIENRIFDSIPLHADKLRCTELFDNIVNNAVKYSPDGGVIIIDVKQHMYSVTVSITDNGMGMTEEQIKHIFDEFYKADSSRHDFDSSGLGMPIAKRIVEKHGGRIWAESEGLGKGSTFYFTLPLHPEKDKAKIKYSDDESDYDIHEAIDSLIA